MKGKGVVYNDGEMLVDHYRVLGLKQGPNDGDLSLGLKEISKAFKQKALELHPDKRPNDPNAHADFQRLKSSYEILKGMDAAARKRYNDDLLRVRRREKVQYRPQPARRKFNPERHRMYTDLKEREKKNENENDPREEELVDKKLKEGIARYRADHAAKAKAEAEKSNNKHHQHRPKTPPTATAAATDPATILMVTWESTSVSDCYTAARLREIFQEFGVVEDVVIRTKSKSSAALVVMSTVKAAKAAAARSLCVGDFCNPLRVVVLKPACSVKTQSHDAHDANAASYTPVITNLVGSSYQAFESSILNIVAQASQKQNKIESTC